jgi:hypothetical protein
MRSGDEPVCENGDEDDDENGDDDENAGDDASSAGIAMRFGGGDTEEDSGS